MNSVKRPYLRADDRRRNLLDAAMTLFAHDGLAGLTMVALAAEAGVSRRLVYEHFADLADLYSAFFADRAAIYQASIDRAFSEGGGNLLDAVTGVFRRMIEIPAEDQRAVRVLVAAAGPRELDAVSEQFRARTIERWLPFVDAEALGPDIARSLVWALMSAILALGDLVCRGEITPEQASVLIRALVTNAGSSAAAAFRNHRV